MRYQRRWIDQYERTRYRWQTRLFLVVACFLSMGFSGTVAAQSSACTNLIADSGLESGTGWAMKTNGRYAMVSNIQAHSGSKSAYLAGANQAEDLLSTKVVVPSGGQSVTLDFWWKVNSENSKDTTDQLTVQVASNTGKIQTVLLVLGSASASNQWQQSKLDISDFGGQSIQLQFMAKTDEALVTDFFIDDVVLLACSAA